MCQNKLPVRRERCNLDTLAVVKKMSLHQLGIASLPTQRQVSVCRPNWLLLGIASLPTQIGIDRQPKMAGVRYCISTYLDQYKQIAQNGCCQVLHPFLPRQVYRQVQTDSPKQLVLGIASLPTQISISRQPKMAGVRYYIPSYLDRYRQIAQNGWCQVLHLYLPIGRQPKMASFR